MKKSLALLFCMLLTSAPVQAAYTPLSIATSRVLSTRGVNFGATGDQGTILIPSQVTKYQITGVQITNCSVTPILAQPALYTATGGGGTNIVAAATITAASSTSVVIASTLATTAAQTSSSLTVRVIVANVAALTCDVYATIEDLT